MEYILPIRTKSEANCRDHWAKKGRRVKLQRNMSRAYAMEAIHDRDRPMIPPIEVMLVRISPGRKLDTDNLAGSNKAIRDGIADALKIDDGDVGQLKFTYDQEKGPPKTYAVRVTITDSI